MKLTWGCLILSGVLIVLGHALAGLFVVALTIAGNVAYQVTKKP